MQREIIPYTDEVAWMANRIPNLNSSDMPVLFGVGYSSYDQLLQAKIKCQPVHVEQNERMEWGNALQDSIANKFAKDNNWTIRKKTEYIYIPELRIGSSFDFEMVDSFLLEIKNVSIDAFKGWIKGFEIEMSPYIEIQVQHQLLVSGLPHCIVGALIGGCEGRLIRRMANKKIQDAILHKAKEFWGKVDYERKTNS